MKKAQQIIIPFPDFPAQKFRAPKKEKPPKAFMEPDPAYNVSLVELSYISKVKPCDMPKVRDSKDAYEIFLSTWDKNKLELQEQFKCMYLDRGNKVKAVYSMSSGGITGTVADTRLMVAAAILLNATTVILAHNHPSSTMVFSRADEMLTQNAVDAFAVHDIKAIDSMILGKPPEYLSMAESQGMPSPRYR